MAGDTSILRFVSNEGLGFHKTLTQTVAGVMDAVLQRGSATDNELKAIRSALGGDSASRHSPCTELSGLRSVWDDRGRPPVVQVVIAHDYLDRAHVDSVRLKRFLTAPLVFGDLSTPPVVEVHGVDVGANGTKIGDVPLAEMNLPDRLAEWVFDQGVDVVVQANSGPSTPKLLTNWLAVLAHVPTVITEQGVPGAYALTHFPLELASADTQARIDLADLFVAGTFDEEPPAEIRSFLVRDSDGTLRRSRLTAHITRLSAATSDRPYAACAELLKRYDRRLAGRLTSLVQKWVDQRLWSLNLVPEMVLHDDRHVARVDRLVAALCAPLLQSGALTPDDVFLLSCAAWLHDWGHVGAEFGSRGGYPTHPLDIRQLHGLLSRALIRNEHWDTAWGPWLERAERDKVGVLVAHHQSHTCCGRGVPEPSQNPIVAAAGRFGVELKSLKDEALAANWEAADLDRVEILVALLRVADAADIGQHRVPYHSSADEYVANCARRVVGTLHSEMQLLLGIDPEHRDAFQQLLQSVERVLANPLNRTYLEALPGAPEAAGVTNPVVLTRFSQLSEYLEFAQKQQQYFVLHCSVLSVRVEHVADGWTTVVTSASLDGEAGKSVEADIKRELENGDGHVGNVLNKVGLAFLGAKSE